MTYPSDVEEIRDDEESEDGSEQMEEDKPEDQPDQMEEEEAVPNENGQLLEHAAACDENDYSDSSDDGYESFDEKTNA